MCVCVCCFLMGMGMVVFIINMGGGHVGITLSICSAVCVSNRVRSISPELLINFFFFTKLGMVVYYHEVMCRAEKNGLLS